MCVCTHVRAKAPDLSQPEILSFCETPKLFRTCLEIVMRASNKVAQRLAMLLTRWSDSSGRKVAIRWLQTVRRPVESTYCDGLWVKPSRARAALVCLRLCRLSTQGPPGERGERGEPGDEGYQVAGNVEMKVGRTRGPALQGLLLGLV